jgi:acyl-CoA synthetase (AMP-forming)/AMP-acid ligase II
VVVLTKHGSTAGKGGKQWSPLDMRRALKEKLANYKIPQEMKVVESIPRNAMGKSKSSPYTIITRVTNSLAVNKKELIKAVFHTS